MSPSVLPPAGAAPAAAAPARVTRPGATRARVARDRLIGWLLAVACITVAAVALQVSEPEKDVQTLVGAPGEPAEFGDGSVTVGPTRVGTRVEEFSSVHTTPGMFVAVPVTLAAEGSDTLRLNFFRLLSGDRVYRPYGLEGITAPPGFAETDEVVFEVDPQGIDGLVLETATSEILSGYHQQLRVPLGITPENAQDWRDAAAGQTIEVARSSERALP